MQYRQVGTSTWSSPTNFGSSSSLHWSTIYGLTNGHAYEVRVRATSTSPAYTESDWTTGTETLKSSDTATRSVNENSSSGVNVGTPVTATDSDNDSLTYSLSGTDAGSFTIVSSSGQIRTKSGVTYDYESKSTYSVIVNASDGNGGSVSKSVTITLNDVNEPPASAPSNIGVTFSDGQLTVTWDAVSNESGKPPVSGYHVERRTGTSGAWGNRQTVSGRTSTSKILTGLTNGQEYYVQVRTVNAEGESRWSAAVSHTPQSLPPTPTIGSLRQSYSYDEDSGEQESENEFRISGVNFNNIIVTEVEVESFRRHDNDDFRTLVRQGRTQDNLETIFGISSELNLITSSESDPWEQMVDLNNYPASLKPKPNYNWNYKQVLSPYFSRLSDSNELNNIGLTQVSCE